MTSYLYSDFVNDVRNRRNASLLLTNGCLQYNNDVTVNCYVNIYNEYGKMEIAICLGTPIEFCRDFNDAHTIRKYIKKAIREFKKELTKTLKEDIL